MPSRHDVIVIGAGFTGLSAATTLVGQGIDVVVLEARDHVGGRAEAAVLKDGLPIDSGGQFFSRDMARVSALADRYGRRVVVTPSAGDAVFLPPLDAAKGKTVYEASAALREDMLTIEPDDPAISGLSVEDWLAGRTSDEDVRAAFRAMVEGLWNQSADMLPLWYLISNDRRVTNDYPELEHFLAETMASLAQDMAAEMPERIRLASPARRIRHDEDRVVVETDNGVFAAAQVVIALPPVMAGRLTYQPPLPDRQAIALTVWSSGAVIKMFLRYERPFWRDQGRSGTVMWRQPTGIYACDASQAGLSGLVVFLSGPNAARAAELTREDLVATTIGHLVEALGQEAAQPTEVNVRNWVDDRWSGGAYGDAITDFDGIGAEADLLAGAGTIHFACSELSSSFPCYIEGAIVAGEEVAARVLAHASSLNQPAARSSSDG